EGAWKVEGDPTEGALYPFASKLGLERRSEQAASPRVDAIPFESEHKFMATLHGSPSDGQVLFAKGAPEVILDHSDRQETRRGEPAPIDREHWVKASDRLAANGERVLAVAWVGKAGGAEGRLRPAGLQGDRVVLGLIGVPDAPRKG